MASDISIIDTIESLNFANYNNGSKKTMQIWEDSNDENYELLTNKVIKSLKIYLFQICQLDSINNDTKLELSDFFNLVNACIKKAESRILAKNLECDKNLLYVLHAAKHILECILDTEFFELTGGYKYPQDILEFGRELYVISKENK